MSARSFFGLLLAGAAGIGAVSAAAQERNARYDPSQSDIRTELRTDDVYGEWEDLPAFISVVDGYAELDRVGQSSRDIENVPLEAGDRLRTTRGRVEVLFDDGSTVALDEHTTVTFVSATDLELVAGRVRAQWRDRGSLTGLTVHTAAGRAIARGQGDYRVTLAASRSGDAEIEVAVQRGSMELANEMGRTIVREGTRALTTAAYAPSVPYAFSSPRDEFERWTDDLERDRYGVESVRYLPDELRYYGGVFDRHGAWHHHASYGWVWYPRVSVGWRPYYGGRWSFVVGFGYSWVGGSRWAWPTHHYGRWDTIGNRWFWVPSRPPQRRPAGFAGPRRSYTETVSYYTRSVQQGSGFRGQVSGRQQGPRSQQGPGSGVQGPRFEEPRAVPRALPRQERPGSMTAPTPRRIEPQQQPRSERPGPSRIEPQRRESTPPSRVEPRRREAPEMSRPTPQRSGPQRTSPPPRESAPQRSAPAPRTSAPERSAPTQRAAPPSSGSRTPSRSSGSAGSGGGSSSGTARRRGGG